MIDVIVDSIIDSVKIFPFVFIIYVLMEIIEDAKNKEKIEKALKTDYAPVFSALTGLVPECGFSVMCAKLYDNGMIKIGTLIAAFIASSDEGLIILFSNGTNLSVILTVVLYKLIFAVFFGLIFNVLLKNFGTKHICPEYGDCLECGERHEKFWDRFVVHPFNHAAKTFIYFIVINVFLGSVIYLIGEEKISLFLDNSKLLQPLLAVIIGLIPNCASSIFIAQSFTEGIICLPALICGLSVNAGMGLLVLFNKKRKIKDNVIIILLMVITSLIAGYVAFI